MSLNPLTYQPHSNFQRGAAMFTASLVQLRLELLVCDRSVSVHVITHTFVGLKCVTETKIQILCDHVDHTCLHVIEMGFQMVQLLSAHIVGPTMFVNSPPPPPPASQENFDTKQNIDWGKIFRSCNRVLLGWIIRNFYLGMASMKSMV